MWVTLLATCSLLLIQLQRNPRKTSRLILTDLSTKIGTLVNGEQIKGKSVVLEKEDNEVTIGKYAEHFRLLYSPYGKVMTANMMLVSNGCLLPSLLRLPTRN